jgi:hypothetical protein
MAMGGFVTPLSGRTERDHHRYHHPNTRVRVQYSCDGKVESRAHAALSLVRGLKRVGGGGTELAENRVGSQNELKPLSLFLLPVTLLREP